MSMQIVKMLLYLTLFRLNGLNRWGFIRKTNLLGQRFGDKMFVIVCAFVVHLVYAQQHRVHAIDAAGSACLRLISRNAANCFIIIIA